MPGEILRVVSGPARGTEITPGAELEIGREAAGEGELGADPELSRHHARLYRDDQGRLVIEDLGSTNGTLVNGTRLRAAQPLFAGDRIELGQSTLELYEPEALAATQVPSTETERLSGSGKTVLTARPHEVAAIGKLVVVAGPREGQTIEIGNEIEFGRDAMGPGRLGNDPQLSRRHARIERRSDGALVLEDLGSTNGTYLNSWPIPSPQLLADGDQIALGQTVLELTGSPAKGRQPTIVSGALERPAPRPSKTESVLYAEGVHKSYGELAVLRGVDLEVVPGEIVGLLGPNGAGKTTFVSIVAGLRELDGGSIAVNGVDAQRHRREARSHMGIAPQELGIYPTMTVRRNLRFFGELAGLRGALLRERVEEIGSALSLTPLFDRISARLSGGQKRRLHTALAMLHHPSLLILDEPTVGADIRTRQEILEVVKRLASEGRAICYSTHYLPEVQELGASVAVLDGGRIIARGSIAELIARHATAAVELEFHGEPPTIEVAGQITREGSILRVVTDDPPATAAAALAQLGAGATRLRRVEIIQGSLDSVYLALTEKRYSSGEEPDDRPLPPPVAIPAGYYSDPTGGAGLRYWDGVRWTDQMTGRRD